MSQLFDLRANLYAKPRSGSKFFYFFAFVFFFFFISSLRSALTCLIFCSDTKGIPQESTQTAAKRLHIKQHQEGSVFSLFFCLHTSTFFIFSLRRETTERLVVGVFVAIFFVPDGRIIHLKTKKNKIGLERLNLRVKKGWRGEQNKFINKYVHALWHHWEKNQVLSSATVKDSSTWQKFADFLSLPWKWFSQLSGSIRETKVNLNLPPPEGSGTDCFCLWASISGITSANNSTSLPRMRKKFVQAQYWSSVWKSF